MSPTGKSRKLIISQFLTDMSVPNSQVSVSPHCRPVAHLLGKHLVTKLRDTKVECKIPSGARHFDIGAVEISDDSE
jgi:hypothetical protein